MKTTTTVIGHEVTPKGAHKITFMGDIVAGTKDEEIGALAARLASEENSNPVEVQVETLGDGKLLIKTMQEMTAPEELGGTADPAPVAGATEVKPDTGATETGEPTLDDVITKGLEAYSDEALLAEVARRLAK